MGYVGYLIKVISFCHSKTRCKQLRCQRMGFGFGPPRLFSRNHLLCTDGNGGDTIAYAELTNVT